MHPVQCFNHGNQAQTRPEHQNHDLLYLPDGRPRLRRARAVDPEATLVPGRGEARQQTELSLLGRESAVSVGGLPNPTERVGDGR